MSDDDANFPFREADLAHHFGVTREYLREARPNGEGESWIRKSREVFWSTPATETLCRLLMLPMPSVVSDDLPEIKTPPTPLIVAQPRLSNSRLLACVPPGSDPTDRQLWCLVRVRDSGRFIRGMAILAEPLEGTLMWRFLGQPGLPEGTPLRYPRGKGRW